MINIYKRASAKEDAIRTGVHNFSILPLYNMPYFGKYLGTGMGLANTGGGIAGALKDAPTDQQIKQMQENSQITKRLPGVSNYRMAIRRKKQGASTAKVLSQNLGGLTSAALLALVAGIMASDDGSGAGTAAGIGLGALTGLAAHNIGAAIAGLTDTRTRKQQRKYDRSGSGTLANFLLPGYAGYNKYKSYGRLIKDQEQQKQQKV